MALDLPHLGEVGIVGFPSSVVVRQPPPSSAAQKPPAAEKESKAPAAGKEKANEKESKAPAAGKKKEKESKAPAAPAPAPTGPPPAEKSKAELAKMSKEERTQYHAARRAFEIAEKEKNAGATPELTKAEKKAAERALQESKRKAKEDKANATKGDDELLAELKLQGLSDDQAKSVMAAMKSDEPIEDEADEDEEGDDADDLHGSVKKWMSEQPDGKIPEDAMRDFNMKVRFQGHVDTTPPDHLETVMMILVGEACKACDLAAPKIQPGAVAKAVGPLLERWANLLCGLHSKIADELEKISVIVGAIRTAVGETGAPEQGQNSAIVGCLMAVRDVDDFVEDEDLLVGCRGVEPKSHVLEKFIEFLEDAIEEDDDDEDDD